MEKHRIKKEKSEDREEIKEGEQAKIEGIIFSYSLCTKYKDIK